MCGKQAAVAFDENRFDVVADGPSDSGQRASVAMLADLGSFIPHSCTNPAVAAGILNYGGVAIAFKH